ncbi:GGDEF domain-containing protein [Inhella gelatinilytica]|uniref:diguanylate cyclase n=1 Tax=Inhella gelatinilytica TaxID=2795030 RepID=A0A931IZ03_9BURK|nr:GGDEF domain-containing protein [Inhella gelatinilytica]MBH9553168.1 GGDEF domain-containing protein [Inhella gelatinilytica]
MLIPGIFILLRLGIQIFLRSPRYDEEALLVILLALVCGLGGYMGGAPLFWSVTYSSTLGAYLLFRTAHTIRVPARNELGVHESRLLTWPLRIIGAVFVGRLIFTLTGGVGDAAPLFVDTPLNVSLLVVLMTAGLLTHLSLGLAVAMRLVQRLHRLSRQDALTALPNRRAGDEHLARLQKRLNQGVGGYAALLVDVDHFKRINDELGHPIGDRALVHLGSCLQHELRSVDLLARYGGEEFLVLLPDIDASDAEQLAERVRQRVESSPLRLGGRQYPLTVSIGWDVARAGESTPALLARADAALYKAKADGRNRVCRSV